MNRNKSLEQVRQESLRVWSDAQRRVLHEAVKNKPVNPSSVSAGLGTGSGSGFENDYVEDDYLSLEYLQS
jgi:hypothetical protein